VREISGAKTAIAVYDSDSHDFGARRGGLRDPSGSAVAADVPDQHHVVDHGLLGREFIHPARLRQPRADPAGVARAERATAMCTHDGAPRVATLESQHLIHHLTVRYGGCGARRSRRHARQDKRPNGADGFRHSLSTLRAECLDWLLVLNRRHLEQALRVYVDHYSRERPHRGSNSGPPEPAEPRQRSP
jgi:hypothetical protein